MRFRHSNKVEINIKTMKIFQVDFDEHRIIQDEWGGASEELAVWDQEGETYARVPITFAGSYITG